MLFQNRWVIAKAPGAYIYLHDKENRVWSFLEEKKATESVREALATPQMAHSASAQPGVLCGSWNAQ